MNLSQPPSGQIWIKDRLHLAKPFIEEKFCLIRTNVRLQNICLIKKSCLCTCVYLSLPACYLTEGIYLAAGTSRSSRNIHDRIASHVTCSTAIAPRTEPEMPWGELGLV